MLVREEHIERLRRKHVEFARSDLIILHASHRVMRIRFSDICESVYEHMFYYDGIPLL